MDSEMGSVPKIVVPDMFVYPEREDHDPGKLERLSLFLWAPFLAFRSRAWRNRMRDLVDSVMYRKDNISAAVPSPINHEQARRDLQREGFSDSALVRVLPVVCTAAKDTLKTDPGEAVLLGALAMLSGRIAELPNATERRLAIIIAAACAAMAGRPVHVLSPDDAHARYMASFALPLYDALGLSMGLIEPQATQEHRRSAYESNITHGAVQQFAFDHLRDRMLLGTRRSNLELKISRLFPQKRGRPDLDSAPSKNSDVDSLRLRGLNFGIVEEADTVLLEAALMPLVITREVGREAAALMTYQAFDIAGALSPDSEYTVVADEYRIDLSDQGRERIHALSDPFGGSWRVAIQREEMVRNALVARTLLENGVHYEVHDGVLHIIDAVLNHLISQPHVGDSLRQMIEAKEGCAFSGRKVPAARSAYGRFFLRYNHLCGAAPTVFGSVYELWRSYKLPVVSVASAPMSSPEHRLTTDRTVQGDAIVERTRTLGDAGGAVIIGVRKSETAERISEALSNAYIAHETMSPPSENPVTMKDLASAGVIILVDPASWLFRPGSGASSEVLADEQIHIIMAERYPLRRTERKIAALVGARLGRAKAAPSGLEYILSHEDPLLETLRTHALGFVFKSLVWIYGDWSDRLAFSIAQHLTEGRAAEQRAEILSMDIRMKQMLAISGQME